MLTLKESGEGGHRAAPPAGHHQHREPDRPPGGQRGAVRPVVLLHLLPGLLPGLLHLPPLLLPQRRGMYYSSTATSTARYVLLSTATSTPRYV